MAKKRVTRPRPISRRDFLRGAAAATGGAMLAGVVSVRGVRAEEAGGYAAVLVDMAKCAGCRTCEAVCSASNHQTTVGGRRVRGLGNPHLANIRVHHFNPDVDVPVTCALCADNPCVAACPIPPDPKTGRKALYRDEATGTVRNDLARCVGCGQCARACAAKRAGVIVPSPKTGKPERMCTLCGGAPQCVRLCPYGALSLVKAPPDAEFKGKGPAAIAEILAERWYGVKKGGE